jgi:hypothetical protein
VSSRAQALLARLACLAVFAAGLGLAAHRLFLGVSTGAIDGPALRLYDLGDDPVGFVLVAAAWTAAAMICFVGCAAFLWALVAKPRPDREAARRARSRDSAA